MVSAGMAPPPDSHVHCGHALAKICLRLEKWVSSGAEGRDGGLGSERGGRSRRGRTRERAGEGALRTFFLLRGGN
jgi:hypothetical protein